MKRSGMHLLNRIVLPLVIFVVAAATTASAQDAAQVLRLSVGFGTLKNTVKMSDETRAEVDRLQKLAGEANASKRYGEALKHMYHGMALMRGQAWTAERALYAALVIKTDRTIAEPSQTIRVHIGQLFQIDENIGGNVSGRIALLPAKADDKTPPLKVLQGLDAVFTDFSSKPFDAIVECPDVQDGNYRLEVRFTGSGDPVTKSIVLRVERGLSARVAAAKERAGRLEKKLKTEKKDGLLAALATPEYQIGLFDLANAGELNVERLNFADALKDASAMMDALEAGRDPFAGRKGDFRKAYRSNVDGSLQPYRVFVPSTYDGSKPFPLIIALHGMGGDENSYFEAYANGAFKTEAEARGYIVACPKGRQPASMYTGSAERDVMDVLAEMQRAYRIDANRIYMTGHSMGGFGTWSVAMNHPDIFAALAPIAGGGNPLQIKKIANIPQIVVHGDDDKTVPVARSRTMVAAAKQAGTEVKYIEVPGGSHINVVVPTFKEVFDWFDAHARKPLEVKAAGSSQR
jgi:predicted esterase